MAYVTTENLCSGMVVARKLLDRNQRVLLRAGVALSESHIQALRSLGIKGLEIRGNRCQSDFARHPVNSGHPVHTAEGGAFSVLREKAVSSSITPETGKPVLEALRITRAASKPLQPKLEPLIAKQTEIILKELLKESPVKENSAIAAVVRLCAIRILHTKKRQKTDVNLM